MSFTNIHPVPRCDVFCNVIDNFGDAGVCWRLVRELCFTRGWQVRLIIDCPALLQKMAPRLAESCGALQPQGIEIVDWSLASDLTPAEIVVEAFGCHLPAAYLTRLRALGKAPVWVNLEYLSAESWIEDCHLLPSPDPMTGIAKFFFFPGFTPRSGGLIREARIDDFRKQMQHAEFRRDWLRKIGIDVSADESLVSLFCYPDSPFDAVFDAWRQSARPVHCLLLEGLAEEDLQKISANATLHGIRITRIPFLPQDDFDRLLMACDVNFVRGEDSFVRALWAGKPFVWQAYRQEELAHQDKLQAFLDRYLPAMPVDARLAVDAWHQGWNGFSPLAMADWAALVKHAPEIEEHLQSWSASLQSNGNLSETLAVFCEAKL